MGWADFVDGKKSPKDPNGHGTHIAGIIANSQVGEDGEWNGMAPGANIVSVRVLNKEGFGTYEQVIQGIQWAVKNKDKYNIKVMNLSLVSPVQSPYWADPLNQAVTRAWAEGITVVVAAGNSGPDPMTVGVPGNNPYVITVGAFTDNYTPNDWNDDYLAPFSAAGPMLDGFVKPDVVAPGAHMVSTMHPNSYLAHQYKDAKVALGYYKIAGTSQAAAVVSGISTLALAENPDLSPDEVKFRVMGTAFPWVDRENDLAGYSIWQQGMGRVNAPDTVYTDLSGFANVGMDIEADLAGKEHYEGYTYYDAENEQFVLKGGFGTWAGGFGTWAGGFGTWAGGFGTWAGGFGTWAGGFGTWAGGFGTWAGSVPWDDTVYNDEAFVTSFMAGESPSLTSTTTSIGISK
ncbi:MAG: Serine protease AprX [Chloroflexi bacterium]|nr:Serine protease AprX [Chloroflexota bacterium]